MPKITIEIEVSKRRRHFRISEKVRRSIGLSIGVGLKTGERNQHAEGRERLDHEEASRLIVF
ncbi:hypothetical protein D3C79_1053190 [compost metagenome]